MSIPKEVFDRAKDCLPEELNDSVYLGALFGELCKRQDREATIDFLAGVVTVFREGYGTAPDAADMYLESAVEKYGKEKDMLPEYPGAGLAVLLIDLGDFAYDLHKPFPTWADIGEDLIELLADGLKWMEIYADK